MGPPSPHLPSGEASPPLLHRLFCLPSVTAASPGRRAAVRVQRAPVLADAPCQLPSCMLQATHKGLTGEEAARRLIEYG